MWYILWDRDKLKSSSSSISGGTVLPMMKIMRTRCPCRFLVTVATRCTSIRHPDDVISRAGYGRIRVTFISRTVRSLLNSYVYLSPAKMKPSKPRQKPKKPLLTTNFRAHNKSILHDIFSLRRDLLFYTIIPEPLYGNDAHLDITSIKHLGQSHTHNNPNQAPTKERTPARRSPDRLVPGK